ncbi:MAG: OpgC domain-containing protein [Chloroflexi bacterium]|nr:OpgC domain-containing protein [Chloroflexota bacterium]
MPVRTGTWFSRALARWRYSESGRRDVRLDLLRGYALFAMICNHVGGISWFSPFTGANRFVVSAAEGFVLLAGLVIGMVYGRRIHRDGWLPAADSILRRAATLYAVTVGLTFLFVALFQFTDLSLWLDRTYGLGLSDPVELVVGTLTLHYTYHGTDILWMYTIMIAAAPLILLIVAMGRWPLVLAGSWLLWLVYQFFPSQATIPWTATNVHYFPVAAWQVIFVNGLVLGYYREQVGRVLGRAPVTLWLALSSVGVAVLVLIQRAHDTGQLASWPILGRLAGELYIVAFDKPSLAFGRLIAFAIVAIFAYSLATVAWLPMRRALGWLMLPLGTNSLRAYGIHLIVIVVVYNIDLLARLYDRSRTGNTIFQIVTVGLTYLVVVTWKRLESGVGWTLPPLALPRFAAGRRRALVAIGSACLAALVGATALTIGSVRASRQAAAPAEAVADAGLLRYLPPDAVPGAPLTVLLVLPGEDQSGPEAAQPLLAEAEDQQWAVVAPTLDYGDWDDPEQVVQHSLANLPLLQDLVEQTRPEGGGESAETPLRVLVLGEGRGAHTALMYALFYPQDVAAIATVGPAPCIVPATEQTETASAPALPYPYGVDDLDQYVGDELEPGDLAQTTIWLGVVADGNVESGACPWGAFAGQPPPERAETFASLIQRIGGQAAVTTATGPAATDELTALALNALRERASH